MINNKKPYKKSILDFFKRITVKQWLIIGGCALLVTGLIFLGIFLYKVFHPSAAFNDTAVQESSIPVPSADQGNNGQAVVPEEDAYQKILAQSDLEFMKDKVNILILGIDRDQAREDWGSFRTDTMILATCDFKEKKMTMISLPRDSLIYICPFDVMARINTAFGHGGGENKDGYAYAMKTASQQLGGIPVNYYIGFDMEVVKSVVDSMGGVDYYVDTLIEVDGRSVPQGQQHLDGQQVLDYCRMRHGSSDIARVDRQQRMLFEIIKQLKSKDQIKNLPDIFKAMQENIRTNLDFTQICSLAIFGKDLDLEKMKRYTLPGKFLNIDKDSYWGVVQSEKIKMVKEIFGIDIKGNAKEDYYRLNDLSERKIKASSSASKKLANGQSNIQTNSAYVTGAEKSKFNQSKSNLLTLINKKSMTNLQSIVEDLEAQVKKFDTWMESLKQAVEAKKAAAPSPSVSPQPPVDPSVSSDPSSSAPVS